MTEKFNLGKIITQCKLERANELNKQKGINSKQIKVYIYDTFANAANTYKSSWIECFKNGKFDTNDLPGLKDIGPLLFNMGRTDAEELNNRLMEDFNIKLYGTSPTMCWIAPAIVVAEF